MAAAEITTELTEWFTERVPKEWVAGKPEVSADEHEILVVLPLNEPDYAKGTDEGTRENARAAAVKTFREDTRERRIEIASQAEQLFNRKVSWGATSGGYTKMWSGLGVPVMTRLRLRERALLDTLVSSGVARSRSEALAWCASLVESKQKEWLDELREATKRVEEVREKGPVQVF